MSCPKPDFEQTVEQGVGLSQNVGVSFGTVYKVVDSNGQLVTTSGRLGTSTISDTIAQVIVGWENRCGDYILFQNGTIIAVLHEDGTYELE